MNGYKLKSTLGLGEMVGQLLVWLLLSIVTLGLALFFLPYYLLKLPINRTLVVNAEGRVVGRLRVDVTFADILGHMLIWLVLSIVTLGLGYIVYWYYVLRRLLNATVIEADAAPAAFVVLREN